MDYVFPMSRVFWSCYMLPSCLASPHVCKETITKLLHAVRMVFFNESKVEVLTRPARANHGSRDELVNSGPPSVLTLTLMAPHQSLFVAINEEIASELLARNIIAGEFRCRWHVSGADLGEVRLVTQLT